MLARHRKLIYLCLALILVFSFASVSNADQPVARGQWIKLKPDTSPPARYGHAMVFYPPGGTNPIAMFGGIGGDGKARNDMWTFENNNWRQINQTGVKPSPRAFHQMDLDRGNVNLVLFGGDDYSDDKTWSQKIWGWKSVTTSDPTTDKPDARSHHAMAYDPVNRIFTMCGGLGKRSTQWNYLKDVWQWTGSDNSYWKRLGKTLARPRLNHKIAFDYVHNKMILFGGVTTVGPPHDSPMKMLEGASGSAEWKDLRPANMPPAELSNFAMASDKDLQKVAIFGGGYNNKLQGDTWVWDGKNWAKLDTNDKPSPRDGCAMVHDPTTQQFVLFGGKTAQGASGETWIFRLATTRFVDPANLNSLDQGACFDSTRPCKTVNYAIRRAVPGDEIRLAAGDYTTENQNTGTEKQVVNVFKSVSLKGGYDSAFANVTGKSNIIGSSRARCIKTDYDVDVSLSDLYMSKGQEYVGGGLFSQGGEKGSNIKLKNVTINGNKADAGGGIYLAPKVTMYLEKCLIANNIATNGGGIYNNRGELVLYISEIAHNQVVGPPLPAASRDGLGGGISQDQGRLTITRCSIHDNQADLGGGIYTFYVDTDPRIQQPPPRVEMNSSTVALNRGAKAGGGIYVKYGKLMINGCTIANNRTDERSQAQGGGIYINQGEVKMCNSILAFNKSLKGGDCLGKIESLGFNLIGDTSQCQAVWKPEDIHAAAGKLMDPKLEAFDKSWGGYPLKIDSPAKDKANPATPGQAVNAILKYDQRGVLREKYWPPDIGAYEEDKKTTPQLPETGMMEIIIYIGMGLIIALMVFRLIRRKKD